MTNNAKIILDRARKAVGSKDKVRYVLGAGGKDPNRATPAIAGACDCSGFVAWCMGLPRHLKNPPPGMKEYNEGWLSTSGIHHDATHEQEMFRVRDWAAPGFLVVYPDWKDAAGRKRQGHVGVVSGAVDGRPTWVAHCSAGNGRKGSAIQETDARAFDRDETIYVELL